MRALLIALLTLGLGGCKWEFLPAPDVSAAIADVNVTASDYCSIAEKITWDVRDTPASIQGMRRENAKYDRRCGPKAAAKVASASSP